jgi:hypothetical protein
MRKEVQREVDELFIDVKSNKEGVPQVPVEPHSQSAESVTRTFRQAVINADRRDKKDEYGDAGDDRHDRDDRDSRGEVNNAEQGEEYAVDDVALSPKSDEGEAGKVDDKHLYVGGVPKVLFSPDGDSYLRAKAKSGRVIEAARVEAGIIVRDLSRKEFGVKLRFSGDATVEGEIRTADFDEEGLRHPDFYATKSMLRALLFLIEKGQKVSNFIATWSNSETMNTNRVAFEQAVEEHRLIDFQDEVQEYLENIDWENLDARERKLIKESAFSTWTGGLLSKLGFNEVSDFQMSESGQYLVFFSRGSPLNREEVLQVLEQG